MTKRDASWYEYVNRRVRVRWPLRHVFLVKSLFNIKIESTGKFKLTSLNDQEGRLFLRVRKPSGKNKLVDLSDTYIPSHICVY